MADADKETLNDWQGLAQAQLRRVGPRRREKFTIAISSEAVSINLDAKSLGRPVAAAIADALKRGISEVQARASDATAEYRAKAERSFREGAQWALRRYQARGGAGLRGAAKTSAETFASTGPHEPNADKQNRLLNDSGHFVRSIVATPTKNDEFVVNVSTRRMDTPLVRQRVIQALTEHVPLFANPRLLGADSVVAEAVAQATEQAVQLRSEAARRALIDALQETGERAVELAQATSEFAEE